jgi:hypothetical protein
LGSGCGYEEEARAKREEKEEEEEDAIVSARIRILSWTEPDSP